VTASKRAQYVLQRVRERLRQPVIQRPNRRKLPGTSVRALLLIVTPVMVMTTLAVLVFVLVLNTASSTERLDLIRTALAVGAGTGAVMTLVLAWRRQWASEHDAAERRLTDLYVKAVEQLGSDKAAVRHGALYALERVAQDNPEHRQTVVNVICAYLRAPYTPPPDKPGVQAWRGIGGSLRATPARRVAATPSAAAVRDEDRRQEREVRLTAQRILTRHLHPGDAPRHPVDSFWADLDLDLTGAHLINFDLAGCRPRRTQFSDVSFSGTASFEHATFTGEASFNGATFTGPTLFVDARFAVPPVMSGASVQACNQEHLTDRASPLGWTQHELVVDGGAPQRRFVPVPVVLGDDR
jgi:Pentapeptide repeats (9 copies)